MKLDSRCFSQEAYRGLIALKDGDATNERNCRVEQDFHKKASGLIQGLSTYISTWGLHRLSGDATKFLKSNTPEKTAYKGKVYREFLFRLKDFSGQDFDPEDGGTLVNMPLREYTSLNHLAIQLAKEWSFWSAAILGEPEEEEG